MRSLPTDDPLAVQAVTAIHAGDAAAIQRLLTAHPGLAMVGPGDADRPGDGGMTRVRGVAATDGILRNPWLFTAGVLRLSRWRSRPDLAAHRRR